MSRIAHVVPTKNATKHLPAIENAEGFGNWVVDRESKGTMDGIKYYGGKREQTSKNTRVKARVKAEALREFMIAKDQVLIMGHKLGDSDSFGAAIGIYKIAASMEKKAHIVINDM